MQTECQPPDLASAGRSDQTSAGVRCSTCVALDCAADMLAAAGPMRPVTELSRAGRSPRRARIGRAISPLQPDALFRKVRRGEAMSPVWHNACIKPCIRRAARADALFRSGPGKLDKTHLTEGVAVMINQATLQGNWNEIQGKLRKHWGQLS